MIQHSADFWKFDLRSRFEVKNGFWAQRNAKSSWFNIRPIFESLICDRDLRSEMDFELNLMQKHHDFNVGRFLKLWSARSEMDFELNLMQKHHDSNVGRFLKLWSAIEIWGQKWILSPTYTTSSWFNNRPIFEILICDRDLISKMDSEPNLMQNHHDSTFDRFLKFWSAINIWRQKWILNPT